MPRLLLLFVIMLVILVTSYDFKQRFGFDASVVLPVVVAAVVGGGLFLRMRKDRKQGMEDVQLGVRQERSLVFSPVWLSSREHLHRLEVLLSEMTWRDRIFGFKLASDMPRVVMPGWGGEVPLVFTAEGVLEVADGQLRFTARERKVDGVTLRSVDATVSFEVSFADVISLSPMTFSSPIPNGPTLHWVRARGETDEATFDLLLAIGGFSVAQEVLHERTTVLQNALERELVLARSARRAQA